MSNTLLDVFSDVAIWTATKTALHQGAFRLDASFYGAENRDALRTLSSSGLKITPLGELAEVFCSNVRERTLVEPGDGYVLLTGSDLGTTGQDELRYVSKVFTRKYQVERLRRGDVLISSAGTVGKCDF